MTLSYFDIVALLLIIVIGLPHGAFDAAIYGLWRSQSTIKTETHSLALKPLVSFLVAYSAIAVCVVIVWLLFPVIALGLFLVISALHFGLGDSRPPTGRPAIIAVICHGGLATLWLPFCHAEVTSHYFTALSGDGARIISDIIAFAGYGWLLAVFGYAILAWRTPFYRWLCFEVICLASLLAYLPVLPGFALYFCFIHSRRHFVHIFKSLTSMPAAGASSSVIPLASILTLASWGGGLIAGLFLWQYQTIETAALQVIFIGLAALTVPHMALVDGLWHPVNQPQNNNEL